MCSHSSFKPLPFVLFILLPLLLWGSAAMCQLNANFSVNKNGGCSPLTVAFTNTTTGASPNAEYKWDLGNGNSSAAKNPGAIYTIENEYTVTLTVTDGAQIASKTQTITVYKKPDAVDFTASVAKGCMPLSVTFASTATPGSGSISSYYWDFGDGMAQQGATSSQQHTYTFVQKAPVTLTVVNNFGCHNTVSKKEVVTVLPALTAAFTADKKVLCKESDPVQFTNYSTGPGTLSYNWEFGDGNTATSKNPNYVFNKKGIYTVKLTVNSSEGCTASSIQTNLLNVAMYKTDFTTPGLICKNQPATFNSTSTPAPDNTVWSINGNPYMYWGSSFNYTSYTAGTYDLTLKNTFGTCTDEVTKKITVKEVPYVSGFIATTKDSCGVPAKFSFKDTTAGAVKWEWDFTYEYWDPRVEGTQQAPDYTYLTPGSREVLLKAYNADGCASSAIKRIETIGPVVGINWRNLDAQNGLKSCTALPLEFWATSNQQIVSYNWKLGDGTTSTLARPQHTYATPGNYVIALDYVTSAGCRGSLAVSAVQVFNKPEVDFSVPATQVCGNNPAFFNATLAPIGNTGNVSFKWNFGDGSYWWHGGQNTTYRYEQDGVFDITVIATNGFCEDTAIKTSAIKILPPFPHLGSITNTCNGTRGEVAFTQTSKDATSLIWDFGDGTTPVTTAGNTAGINHTYNRTGTYQVTLTAVNGSCSVKDFGQTYVLLKQQPQLTTNKAELCREDQLGIKVTNYEKNPRESSTTWPHYNVRLEYGDGTYFNGYLTNSYNWSTVYDGTAREFEKNKTSLRVITTSSYFGCQDTTNTVPVKIKGDATAGFDIVTNNVCFKDAIQLKDTSRSASSTIQKWLWNFGDGQTSTQSGTVSHTYNNPGYYYISLQVTDASGCTAGSASWTSMVTINGPKADFSMSGTSVPIKTNVSFYNNTNNTGSSGTKYEWQIDGVPFSTLDYPNYTFQTPGTYKIKLKATNPVTNCSSEIEKTLTVLNFNAGFNFTKTNITGTSCPPVMVRFNNTSVNYTSIIWDFGDGFSLENINQPSHIYEKPGKYFITLYVYGPAGLKDQYLDSLVVAMPAAQVQTSSTEGCVGHEVTLNATIDKLGTYTWDFGDGNVRNTADSFSKHQYAMPGKYAPALLMQNGSSGCTGTAALPATITIRPNPTVQMAPNDPVICLGASVNLSASGGLTYSWTPATALSDATSPAPVAAPVTTTTYSVKVADDIGCSNSKSVKVTVQQPQTIALRVNDAELCKGETANLVAGGTDQYNWIYTTDGLSATTIANPSAKPDVSVQYTVVGSDKYNCFTDTAQIDITVRPLPSVDAGADAEVWAGNPAHLNATGSSDVLGWMWTPATALSCVNCPNPTSTALTKTMYTITVNNQYGCTAKDSAAVHLLCDENRVAIPNGFTPNNDNYNDVFMIRGISIVRHLVIFNRYGQKVYERSNFVAGDRSLAWNGTFNGFPAAEGTYVYLAELECPTGGAFTRKGTILLMR